MTLVLNSKGVIEDLARNKKTNDETMMGYAKRYKAYGFVPFTLNLGINKEGKKFPYDIPSFSLIDSKNCLDNVNNNKNCMALRMGTKCKNDDNYYVVLFDVDATEDENTQCGMTKWKELLEDKKEINTPTQKTGNNGLHYLFKVSEDNFNKLPRLITKIMIDGVRYSLDFKGENQMMFVAPTNYYGKSYKWTTDFTEDIQEMPKWLLTIILRAGGKTDQKKQKKLMINNTNIEHQNDKVIDLDAENCNMPIMKNISLNNFKNTKNMSIKNNTIQKCYQEGSDSETNNGDDTDSANIISDDDNKENNQNCIDKYECIKGVRCYFSYKKELLKQILLGLDTYDIFSEWYIIGMALKNESSDGKEYFDIWHEWSKQSKIKYKGKNDCKYWWNNKMKNLKTGGRYTIINLVAALKEKNENVYNNIKANIEMFDLLTEYKNVYFKEYRCTVKEIENTDRQRSLIFADTHCPTYGGIHSDNESQHDKSCVKFVANQRGKAYMECTHKNCRGRMTPINGISLDGKTINNIFVVNNNVTNNYNMNKYVYDVQLVIKNMTGVFFDEELNKKMIKSFNKNDNDIAEAIAHVCHDTIIFTDDNEWYYLDGNVNRWKKSTNITDDVIRKFSLLYDKIKQYVDELSLDIIFEIEKHESKNQIQHLVNTINNEKHNKKIIRNLQDKCKISGNQIFDINKSLFAFNNGTYDFETMTFGQNNSSDMISKTSGYDYSDSYVNKQNLMDVLLNMFESYEIMEGFLLYVAISICSDNDMNPVLLARWAKQSQYATLKNCLCGTFGEYHCGINQKGIITNSNNIMNENYLRSTRLLIIESANSISNNELCDLANVSVRSITIDKNKLKVMNCVNFSTICMCENEPKIPNDEMNKFRYVSLVNKASVNKKIYQNDFFLLLTDFLKKYNVNNKKLSENINDIKIDNRTVIEKLYDEFIEEYFEKGDNDDRCKCSDIKEKFKSWKSRKGIKTKLSSTKLYERLKTHQYVYHKSIRFSENCFTTGFFGIKIK
jgi:hypothetical protein